MSGNAIARARYEPAARQLRLLFAGPVDSEAYLACMRGWLEETPEAAEADWLYDLTRYEGSVTHDDVAAFGRLYDLVVGTRDAGAASVFATPDPGFRFWVRACVQVFPRRRLIVANTLGEAEAILEARRQPAR